MKKERRRSIRYRLEGDAPAILVMSGDTRLEGVLADISVLGASIRIDQGALAGCEASTVVQLGISLEGQEQRVAARIVRKEVQGGSSVLCVHLEGSIFHREIMDSLLRKHRAGAIAQHGDTLVVLGTLTLPLAEEIQASLDPWGIRSINLNSCFEIEDQALPVLDAMAERNVAVRGRPAGPTPS